MHNGDDREPQGDIDPEDAAPADGFGNQGAVERTDDAARLARRHQHANGQRLRLAAEGETDHAHGNGHDGAAAHGLERPKDRQPFERGRQRARDRAGDENEDGDVKEQAVAQQVGNAPHYRHDHGVAHQVGGDDPAGALDRGGREGALVILDDGR